jgi:putative ABC transport system permease protein
LFDVDKWQEIFSTLQRNKLRTFMTACGVFWGIFMLILMLGFGNGLEYGVSRSMSGLSANSVFVWGEKSSMAYKGLKPGRLVQFHEDDIPALRRIEGIEYLAPRVQLGGWQGGGGNVSRGDKTSPFTVMGDYPDVQHIDRLKFRAGRFLNKLDIDERRKVAVIGKDVYAILFSPGEDPIGEYIKIKGVYFQVVGVFEPYRTGDSGDREGQTIFIPFTTFQQAFNQKGRIGWLAMTAEPEVPGKEIEKRVRTVLAERHKIHPEDEAAMGSFNAQKEFQKIRWLFTGIRSFIWFVGIMTLLAGVLGVSNIMLIVVKERTKEIGVRRALGATPYSIVSLVMQESVVLTALAGYAGLCAGVGLLELSRSVVGEGGDAFANPSVDLTICLIATLVLIVAGAIAGVIPARHAASIKPVVALRAE